MKTIREKLLVAKSDTMVMESLIMDFFPLIRKYVKKLYFIERPDAEQEMIIAFIKAVKGMYIYNSEGEVIKYLENALYFSYCSLCKDNIIKDKYKDLCQFNKVNSAYIEKFQDVEFCIDIQNNIKLTMQNKIVISKLLEGFSDTEIAETLNVSRQYINRMKKKIKW